MEKSQINKNNDVSLSGMLFISLVLIGIMFVMFLLSIQKKAENCTQIVKADGTIITECKPDLQEATESGTIKFLPDLQDKADEVDKTLQKPIIP